MDAVTKALLFSDTSEFYHNYCTHPTVTHKDRILHALKFLLSALQDAPNDTIAAQFTAISRLHELFHSWQLVAAPEYIPPIQTLDAPPQTFPPAMLLPRVPMPPYPRVNPFPPPPVDDGCKTFTYERRSPKGRTPTPPPSVLHPLGLGLPPVSSAPPSLPAPAAYRTHSRFAPSTPSTEPPIHVVPIDQCTPSKINKVVSAMAASGRRYPLAVISNMAVPVLDHDTGLSLQNCHLLKHPKYQDIWSKLYPNELGRLYQGVGSNS